MRGDRRARGRALTLGALLVSSLGAMGGCRATTQDLRTYGGPPLARPQLIVVHDFTSMPGDVSLDSGVPGQVREQVQAMQGTPLTEQQIQLRQTVTRIMTAQLVQEIRKLGMPAEAAATAGSAAGSTLSIEGQFLTIDEGNRTRRLVVGLGAGASEVRAAVQIFDTISGQHRLVEDFYTTARSSRKPGFGPFAGLGAARGVAGETMLGNIGVSASMGPQDAEGDTKKAAVEVTRQLADFFARQGWITPEQAERYRLVP